MSDKGALEIRRKRKIEGIKKRGKMMKRRKRRMKREG